MNKIRWAVVSLALMAMGVGCGENNEKTFASQVQSQPLAKDAPPAPTAQNIDDLAKQRQEKGSQLPANYPGANRRPR